MASLIEDTIRYMVEKSEKVTIRTTVFPIDLEDLCNMADELNNIAPLSRISWDINPVLPFGLAADLHLYDCMPDYSFFESFNRLKDYVDEHYGIKQLTSSILLTTPIVSYCGDAKCKNSSVCVYPSGRITCCMDYKQIDPLAMFSNGKIVYNKEYVDVIVREYHKMYN